ncbi:hypothetical protein HZC21_01960 [Candidatus Peregrinibacteria bacterium]|nr:hypothetical protein [Candidatus Peregrinibacteria bacterium]
MNLHKLHKELGKGNPWSISRPVYQLRGAGPANVEAIIGGNKSREKPMSPEEIREALKRLRDDVPAFERYRLEALENFKKKVLEHSHDFEGSDLGKAQTVANKVFQYAYDKLENFFKKDLNRNWPIKIYKDWMDAICNAMAEKVAGACGAYGPFAPFLQTNESDIDIIFQHLGSSWKYIGTFEEYFARTAPQVFEEWKKQNLQQKQNE